jgi:hypothetical protein
MFARNQIKVMVRAEFDTKKALNGKKTQFYIKTNKKLNFGSKQIRKKAWENPKKISPNKDEINFFDLLVTSFLKASNKLLKTWKQKLSSTQEEVMKKLSCYVGRWNICIRTFCTRELEKSFQVHVSLIMSELSKLCTLCKYV